MTQPEFFATLDAQAARIINRCTLKLSPQLTYVRSKALPPRGCQCAERLSIIWRNPTDKKVRPVLVYSGIITENSLASLKQFREGIWGCIKKNWKREVERGAVTE